MGSRAPRHPTKVAADRSAGGVALRRTGVSQPAIAEKVGVDASAVNRWISGAKKPGPASRAKLSEHYGIASELWDTSAKSAKAQTKVPAGKALPLTPPAPAPLTDAEAAGGAWEMAKSLQRDIKTQLDELFLEGSNWAKAERAQVSSRLATAINVLAKLTGQYDLERRFFDLPSWRMVERELEAALADHPAAAEAVRVRFADLHARRPT